MKDDIYRNINTPCYIINKEELETNFNQLNDALKNNWNNYIIGYSYKTNSLPWVVNFFDQRKCYSEVVSEEEYELGKLLGVKKNCFIYNGPIKTKSSFKEAINNGCYVNIDSNRELEWLDDLPEEYKLGIRVNFDIERYCPGESQCGNEGGRFGFCYENKDLDNIIKILNQKNIKISGLHLHTSSKTRSLNIYRAISKFVVKLMNEYKLDLNYIDIGGGFFGGLKDKPQFDEYINVISEELGKVTTPEKTTLIVEPGISLIGTPISYVTTVIDVKDTSYNRFIITDGSRTNIDPLMNKKNYSYECIYLNNNIIIHPKQIICGYTCLEHDRIFIEENKKELQQGDKIIYNKVGAYTLCLTPLFIKYFPDVYVLDNDKIKKIRSKWTPVQYLQNHMLGDDDK